MGVFGLVFAAVWYELYRDPRVVALAAAESRYRCEGDTTGEGKPATMSKWRRLFTYCTV